MYLEYIAVVSVASLWLQAKYFDDDNVTMSTNKFKFSAFIAFIYYSFHLYTFFDNSNQQQKHTIFVLYLLPFTLLVYE